ncbi:hypothetical protein V6N13_065426 [Hibiscus sabdariffa]
MHTWPYNALACKATSPSHKKRNPKILSLDVDLQWSIPLVLDLVREFYNVVNVKDTQKLEQLLSDDCVFQDLIFYIPFGGKQKLLKAISTVFDNFPFAADQLLSRSEGTHEGIIKLLEMLGAYKKD